MNPNGTWNLNLPSLPSGFPGEHSMANNKVLNEYAQAAYLANSDLVGLGRSTATA
ncbi:hypothetical protein [Stigmatella aurantiaca]|uniref:hypothetical protein n=1 Tax=Stigmatella aurantiaca TaxID=41 RepID=UPI00031A3CCC|nr:hypothetical protein [Stigmatella aurantiaca]